MFKSYIMLIPRHLAIHGTRWVILTTLDLHVQVPKLGTARYLIDQRRTWESRSEIQGNFVESSLLFGFTFGSAREILLLLVRSYLASVFCFPLYQ